MGLEQFLSRRGALISQRSGEDNGNLGEAHGHVGETDGDVIGYAHAAVEGYNYMALRGPQRSSYTTSTSIRSTAAGASGRLLLGAAL